MEDMTTSLTNFRRFSSDVLGKIFLKTRVFFGVSFFLRGFQKTYFTHFDTEKPRNNHKKPLNPLNRSWNASDNIRQFETQSFLDSPLQISE